MLRSMRSTTSNNIYSIRRRAPSKRAKTRQAPSRVGPVVTLWDRGPPQMLKYSPPAGPRKTASPSRTDLSTTNHCKWDQIKTPKATHTSSSSWWISLTVCSSRRSLLRTQRRPLPGSSKISCGLTDYWITARLLNPSKKVKLCSRQWVRQLTSLDHSHLSTSPTVSLARECIRQWRRHFRMVKVIGATIVQCMSRKVSIPNCSDVQVDHEHQGAL